MCLVCMGSKTIKSFRYLFYTNIVVIHRRVTELWLLTVPFSRPTTNWAIIPEQHSDVQNILNDIIELHYYSSHFDEWEWILADMNCETNVTGLPARGVRVAFPLGIGDLVLGRSRHNFVLPQLILSRFVWKESGMILLAQVCYIYSVDKYLDRK